MDARGLVAEGGAVGFFGSLVAAKGLETEGLAMEGVSVEAAAATGSFLGVEGFLKNMSSLNWERSFFAFSSSFFLFSSSFFRFSSSLTRFFSSRSAFCCPSALFPR